MDGCLDNSCPYTRCDGTKESKDVGCCFDLQTDAQNCGACGNRCPEGFNGQLAYCLGGACYLEALKREVPKVVQVAAGSGYSVALLSDGTVRGWGLNNTGQLAVSGIKGAKRISAGRYLGAAILESGAVVAWGTSVSRFSDNLPRSGARQISAGTYSLLVLDEPGRLTIHGDGLALPSFLESVTIDRAYQGTYLGAALLNDGSVLYWDNLTPSGNYVDVVAGSIVSQICVGGSFGLALLQTGAVVGWGYNVDGQTNVIRGLEGETQSVICGESFGVAVLKNGSLRTWGVDVFKTTNEVAISGVTQLAAGSDHVIAIMDDGLVTGWGSNDTGQLAIPQEIRSNYKVPVVVNTPQGPPTNTPTVTSSPSPTSSPLSLSSGAIAGIVVAGVAVLAALGFAVFWRSTRRRKAQALEVAEKSNELPGPSSSSEPLHDRAKALGIPKKLIIESKDIQIFKDKVLGQGGFGIIYEGMDSASRRVAVKVIHSETPLADHFWREVRNWFGLADDHGIYQCLLAATRVIVR